MKLHELKLSLRRLRAFASHTAGQIRPGSRLTTRMLPRVAKAPDRGNRLALVAIVKDEQDYIAEWMEYYLLQGVSRFVIYDNGSTDATAEIVKTYAKFADCKLVPWTTFLIREASDWSMQALAYTHALLNFGSDVRWMAFLDVDEFLFATGGERLVDALADFTDMPSLSFPWTNFGPNGHATKPTGLVVESYMECAPLPLLSEQSTLLRYKTVVDPSEVNSMGTHFFPLVGHGAVFFNERREKCPIYDARNMKFACRERFQLNHYFTRSEEELARRIAKGRVSKNGNLHTSYVDRRLAAYRRRTAVDDTILQFLPALRAQMASRASA